MKALSRLIAPDRIVQLSDGTKADCLRTLVGVVARSAGLEDNQTVLNAILEREKLLSTAFGLGRFRVHRGVGGHRGVAPVKRAGEPSVIGPVPTLDILTVG